MFLQGTLKISLLPSTQLMTQRDVLHLGTKFRVVHEEGLLQKGYKRTGAWDI